MSDTLIEYARERVRNLENRYTTWAHHPSYDSKKALREEAIRVRGVLDVLADTYERAPKLPPATVAPRWLVGRQPGASQRVVPLPELRGASECLASRGHWPPS